jgi:quinol monooxygenase YgiN
MPADSLQCSRQVSPKSRLASGPLAAKAIMFLSLISTLSGAGPARAQSQDAAPVYTVSYFEVAAPSQEQASGLLKSLAGAARKNPDNVAFAPLRRRTPAHHFAIVEVWKDAKAFEAHATSPERKEFFAALGPLLTAPLDERPHVVLAANAARSKAAIETAGPDAIFAVTHVDVIPTKKEEGIAATKGLYEPASKAAGNMSFDVLQQVSRQNHMTLFESWKSVADLIANAGQDYMKSYRFTLLPMSGALFDRRTYTVIR